MRPRMFGLVSLIALLAGASPPEPPANDLVVHEWGTFLAMGGPDGVALDGMYHEEHGLPSFVHARGRDQLRAYSAFSKGETPVIYFYTAKEQPVRVEVKFPRGLWTQWYPSAAGVFPKFGAMPSADTLRDGRIVWNASIIPAEQGASADPARHVGRCPLELRQAGRRGLRPDLQPEEDRAGGDRDRALPVLSRARRRPVAGPLLLRLGRDDRVGGLEGRRRPPRLRDPGREREGGLCLPAASSRPARKSPA